MPKSDLESLIRMSGAEHASAEVQLGIGDLYRSGEGVRKNYTEAVRWYRMAADHGSADGMNSLGYRYKNGQGVEKDEAEAVRWYRKAAELGDAAAQNNLGTCYAMGEGVEKDEAEAEKWFRKAADQAILPRRGTFRGSTGYQPERVRREALCHSGDLSELHWLTRRRSSQSRRFSGAHANSGSCASGQGGDPPARSLPLALCTRPGKELIRITMRP